MCKKSRRVRRFGCCAVSMREDITHFQPQIALLSSVTFCKQPYSIHWCRCHTQPKNMRSVRTHTPFDHIHLLFLNLHMYAIHSFLSEGNQGPSGPLVHIINDSPNFSVLPQRSGDSHSNSSIIISSCTRWADVFNAVVYSANPLRFSQSNVLFWTVQTWAAITQKQNMVFRAARALHIIMFTHIWV